MVTVTVVLCSLIFAIVGFVARHVTCSCDCATSTGMKQLDEQVITGKIYNCDIIPILRTVTHYVVPFVTHIRTKETKSALVGQVQGYLISSLVF